MQKEAAENNAALTRGKASSRRNSARWTNPGTAKEEGKSKKGKMIDTRNLCTPTFSLADALLICYPLPGDPGLETADR